ncbi:Phage minor capsid protein 2 [Paenibacillus sophorae]|uniref:Phage minor capsid protein n=1 Tax=Paenibacillus sophorae TaxID=1333845 RepID=A0A1H8L9V6_9BACL|nr:phage minor capsid protein [Paenibacillus sophorae]QWU17383.1 phage minor capsid protein [Paenibacillus sophorae]SEO01498.1 Phage minor capsid protein 2 [Paenibacillus sophorae]
MATPDEIIALYIAADERLRRLLQELESGNLTARRQRELEQQIDAIIAELTGEVGQQLAELIGEQYRAGAMAAVEQLAAAKVTVELINDSLEPIIHQQAAQAIMDEAFYSILEASEHMTADAKRRIRDIVQAANQLSMVDGVSRRKATKQAISDANAQGITGMVAKNGARIPAEKYMASVVQFHQRKAHVTGVEQMAIQNDRDLLYVNYVGITCSICAKYQGRVYSISGNDPRFPRLERRPPYHSHCVHSMSVWVEEYTSAAEIEQAIQDSNRPFEDNRTEANIRRYEELQREKSRKNETRKQWIRYKAVLPNDTPNLKQFASHKVRGTKKYAELQELYRKVNIEIKKQGG